MRTRSASGGGGLPKLAGSKRAADESNLNDDQRFTKRFNLLSLDRNNNTISENSNLYIPVASPAPVTNGIHHSTTAAAAPPLWTTPQPQPQPRPPTSTPTDEVMQIDETPNRVYIHDLDREIADLDSSPDEEEADKLIFLPDIEKRFNRIPAHLLSSHTARDIQDEHQELVLYTTPKSLSVGEGHDAVRKAVLEARQRARERAAEEARREDMERLYGSGSGGVEGMETAHGYAGGYGEVEREGEVDPDAMDIG